MDVDFWKNWFVSASSWNSDSGWSKGSSGYDLDFNREPIGFKKKHKFSPILLIYSTVYNCEYCGVKKEDCKSDYCESEDDKYDNEWSTGGW